MYNNYDATRLHSGILFKNLMFRVKIFSYYYGVLTPLNQWWKNLQSSKGLKCLVPFPACCQIGNWLEKGHKGNKVRIK